MQLDRPWRWNRFGAGTHFLDAGRGVEVMAAGGRAASSDEAWAWRAAGTRHRRAQVVRVADGNELVGVSLDWAGSGTLDGTPGWRWERSGPRDARIVDARGGTLLHFTRDADPETGASIEVAPDLARERAVLLSTFAWMLVRHEARGTVMVGESRGVRRVWR